MYKIVFKLIKISFICFTKIPSKQMYAKGKLIYINMYFLIQIYFVLTAFPLH